MNDNNSGARRKCIYHWKRGTISGLKLIMDCEKGASSVDKTECGAREGEDVFP